MSAVAFAGGSAAHCGSGLPAVAKRTTAGWLAARRASAVDALPPGVRAAVVGTGTQPWPESGSKPWAPAAGASLGTSLPLAVRGGHCGRSAAPSLSSTPKAFAVHVALCHLPATRAVMMPAVWLHLKVLHAGTAPAEPNEPYCRTTTALGTIVCENLLRREGGWDGG